MPRAKATKKTETKKNAAAAEPLTNGDSGDTIALQKPEEIEAPAKKAASRKKATKAPPAEEPVSENDSEPKAPAKGRGGKRAAAVKATADEEAPVVVAVEEVPKKGRARTKAAPKAEEKPKTSSKAAAKEAKEEPAAKKTSARGQKKKEEVPEPEPEPAAEPEESGKRGSKRGRAAPKEKAEAPAPSKGKSSSVKAKAAAAPVEEDISSVEKPAPPAKAKGKKAAAPKKGKSVANGQDEESMEVEVVAPKTATASRKRGKAASKSEDILIDEPSVELEDAADIPKKKSKKTDEKKVPEKKSRSKAKPEEDDDADKKSDAKKKPLQNATTTEYNKADFAMPDLSRVDSTRSSIEGDAPFNLKISSWNVAGLRAWLKKDGLRYLEYEEPDIFCLQETKCSTDMLPEEVTRITGYHPYWLCMPGGYAGVAIYSKIMPINVEYGIGHPDFDDVGRLITAEYEKFILINVYVPNSGRKLINLAQRMRWEDLFQQFVKKLDARKPLIICGDMNVSHLEIDLANPKTNTRNAGFTKEERDKMTELLGLGFVDTFRHLYPDRKGAYTFWTYMSNARARNVGWRLDYFLMSERLVKRAVDNCIRSQVMGSDHCPITLFLKI